MKKKRTFQINQENDFKFYLHLKGQKKINPKVSFKNIFKIAAFFQYDIEFEFQLNTQTQNSLKMSYQLKIKTQTHYFAKF